jgi:hypothetical protein
MEGIVYKVDSNNILYDYIALVTELFILSNGRAQQT